MLREQIKKFDGPKKKSSGGNAHFYSTSKEKTGKSSHKMSPLRDQNLNFYDEGLFIPPDEADEVYNEEINIIQSMWDELGVTEYYKTIYETISRQLNGELRKEFFDFEMNSLKRFSDNLLV
jgi:hypothetical protein